MRAGIIALLLISAGGQAKAPVNYADVQLADPAQERVAADLMASIRCVVCQGQSIADSDAGLAGDMRALIREKIAAGQTPEDIRAWLIDHYGDWVSYAPILTPTSAALWVVPILALLAGVFLIRGQFQWRKRR
jgi:cytochrome c-type biogenesis protein CcmH